LHAVSVSAKLTRREAELLERLTRAYGFVSKSEAIRSALRLYLNLFELKPKDRLRTLQVINELIAPSAKTASDLIEEEHREEDELGGSPWSQGCWSGSSRKSLRAEK
jgi:Arc/MetJ-type ribon-helix-helix transcriptional regulator